MTLFFFSPLFRISGRGRSDFRIEEMVVVRVGRSQRRTMGAAWRLGLFVGFGRQPYLFGLWYIMLVSIPLLPSRGCVGFSPARRHTICGGEAYSTSRTRMRSWTFRGISWHEFRRAAEITVPQPKVVAAGQMHHPCEPGTSPLPPPFGVRCVWRAGVRTCQRDGPRHASQPNLTPQHCLVVKSLFARNVTEKTVV